jgi:signal transduction histidine kinase
VHDISDQKRRRALERIFFHDVLNTAGSLGGYAELLQDSTGRDVEEFGSIVHQLAEQLIDEIQSQQTLLLAEHGELKPVRTTVPAHRMIFQAVQPFEHSAAVVGKKVRIVSSGGQMHVQTDPVLLRRVLVNMVKNALEATRPGSAVSIGCEQLGGRARFWVHNPEHIPNDIQLQIFQRSFSTKGRDRGLGTYSMKLLAERYLDGHVAFESTPEHGTIFSVDVPLGPSVN